MHISYETLSQLDKVMLNILEQRLKALSTNT